MQTVADILIHAVDRAPDHTALISGDRRMSYRELLSEATAVGAALQAQGLRPGDRILTLLQNHHGAAILHWAAQLHGLVICPINWRSTATELEYFAADCGARAIFFDDSARQAATEYGAGRDLLLADASPDHWDDAPWKADVPPCPLPVIDETDTSVILYTSGTTGPGKGVPRTHRAERAAALVQVAQNALPSWDVALGVMPLYHTMGVRVLLTTAFLNGTFVCQPKFQPDQSLDLIESHAVSSLYLVPTLYHDLMIALEKSTRDLGSIRRLGFAGATMTHGLLARVSARFPGINLVNHYGSSEIYTYTIDQDAARKPGSAGRMGLNSQIAVIPLGSDDVKARTRPGEEGQVIASLRSAEAFSGYLNRPEANAKAIRNGWYLTGDVGYLDADGDLFLSGRVDDMIITGGENVMPVEIESVLSLHKGIEEVVVVGKPDERLGQCITAHVVAKLPISHDELDKHCRDAGLPGFRCPKKYFFVDEIPKSPVGKTLRRLV